MFYTEKKVKGHSDQLELKLPLFAPLQQWLINLIKMEQQQKLLLLLLLLLLVDKVKEKGKQEGSTVWEKH